MCQKLKEHQTKIWTSSSTRWTQENSIGQNTCKYGMVHTKGWYSTSAIQFHGFDLFMQFWKLQCIAIWRASAFNDLLFCLCLIDLFSLMMTTMSRMLRVWIRRPWLLLHNHNLWHLHHYHWVSNTPELLLDAEDSHCLSLNRSMLLPPSGSLGRFQEAWEMTTLSFSKKLRWSNEEWKSMLSVGN